MVILSDNLYKRISNGESDQTKRTHLLLSHKSIHVLEALKTCNHVEVVDLRNNKIVDIKNLANLKNLTHLYLQNNNIEVISGGLANLSSLKVLFLDFNEIEVIEKLDNCPLEKLSIKGQRLGRNVVMGFDPLCMKKLQTHLTELKASGNKLRSIRGLIYLTNLEALDISNNVIKDLNSFSNDLSKLEYLKKLNINNNPIVKNVAFFSKTVSACRRLEYINEVPITYQTRIYCENMYMSSRDKPMNTEKLHLINEANKSSSNFPVSLRPRINEKLLSEIKKKWKPPKRH